MIGHMSTPPATDAQKIAAYRTALEAVLTLDRLASYQPTGGDDLATLTTYF